MWHALTSGKYTRSRKQIPEVAWDTQEETQPLELPHRLTFVARSHHCHQALPMINNATNDSLANCFMDTYLPRSAGQCTDATHSVAKWPLSDRFMCNPSCIFCHSDGYKKVKKAYYWTMEPLYKFESGCGETVVKTTEAKHKIMISFHRSRDRNVWLWSPVPPKLSEKVHKTPRTMVQCGCR